MPGRGFDLEATLTRIERKLDALDAKLDGLDHRIGDALSRIDAKLELLRLDLLDPTLGAEREAVQRLRNEHDAALATLRRELDTLRQRVKALGG